nr:hypothetical protein [Tanacetum cinerariifolium]
MGMGKKLYPQTSGGQVTGKGNIMGAGDGLEVPMPITYRNKLVVESLKEAEAQVTEVSSKRAREELEQENAKKQKMEDDKEFIELKQCLEIIPGDGDDKMGTLKGVVSRELQEGRNERKFLLVTLEMI